MEHQRRPSLLTPLLIAVVIILILAYLGIALNTQDALFFVKTFEEEPYQLLVHCFGDTLTLNRGSEQFDELNNIFNRAMSGDKYWDSLTMSDDTYNYYQTSEAVMVLELLYSPPVLVHSSVKFFKNVDTLVVPLVGRHASAYPVFGRTQTQHMNEDGERVVEGISTAGSFHLENTAPILEYIESQGLCQNP